MSLDGGRNSEEQTPVTREVSRAGWIPAYSGSHENHGHPGMTTDPPADRQRNASRVFSDSVCTGKEFRDKSHKP